MIRGRSRIRYKKFYTVKEWKRFRYFLKDEDGKYIRDEKGDHVTMQQFLCNTYDVYLTDWKSRKERLLGFLNKFTLVNFNKGLDAVVKGIDEFSKSMEQLNRELTKGKKDYSVLLGKPNKKASLSLSSKRDYSFLTGSKQKSKRKSKRKSRKEPDRDYSALIGSGKRDYSFLTGKK